MSTISVDKLYKSVIAEVIDNMKEAVLDEGIDEQVLAELKQLWEQKLAATKATEAKPMPSHFPISPAAGSSRSKHTGAGTSTQAAATIVHTNPQAMQLGAPQVYRPAPVRPHQTQPLDMSGAAATATMALPPIYQQQILAANIQLQQTSTGITAVIPANAIQSGNLNIRPVQQQIQPQNLSTKVPGQLDGANDSPEGADMPLASAASTHSGISDTHLTKTVDTLLTEALTSDTVAQPCPDTSCRPKTTVARPRKKRRNREIEVVIQLDGADSSSEDDDDLDDDDEDDVDNEGADGEGDEEPLNSGDDDDDDDASATMFEMENVIVCQYDKITRSKNKWRFTLKDGIMNINQRDYVFHKAHGEAEW